MKQARLNSTAESCQTQKLTPDTCSGIGRPFNTLVCTPHTHTHTPSLFFFFGGGNYHFLGWNCPCWKDSVCISFVHLTQHICMLCQIHKNLCMGQTHAHATLLLAKPGFWKHYFLLILGDSKVEKKVHNEREPCGTQWGSKERKWVDKAATSWRGRRCSLLQAPGHQEEAEEEQARHHGCCQQCKRSREKTLMGKVLVLFV